MDEIVFQLLRQALFFPWPKICRKLDDMLKAGVVEESKSTWASVCLES